jgi:hypothetical protein
MSSQYTSMLWASQRQNAALSGQSPSNNRCQTRWSAHQIRHWGYQRFRALAATSNSNGYRSTNAKRQLNPEFSDLYVFFCFCFFCFCFSFICLSFISTIIKVSNSLTQYHNWYEPPSAGNQFEKVNFGGLFMTKMIYTFFRIHFF